MIRLFLQRGFLDIWDNLFVVVVFNGGLLVGAGVLSWPVFLLPESFPTLVVLVLLLLVVGSVWATAAALAVAEWQQDLQSGRQGGLAWRSLLRLLPTALLPALWFTALTGLCSAMVAGLSILALAQQPGSFPALLVWGLVFWAGVFTLAVLLWYLPMLAYARERKYQTGVLAVARRCLLFVADNAGFASFMLLYSLFSALLSLLTLGLVPGIAGLQVQLAAALRLRLLKYDWLETNPGQSSHRPIPWTDVLRAERERIGSRSMRNLLFPWKD